VKAWVVSAAVLVASWTLSQAALPPAEDPMGNLGRRLQAAGRAEVRFERNAPDPFGGAATKIAGRLALESSNRAELRFPSTGERLTLREDGGEWLQPELRQMIVFQKRHASAALRWWQAVLGAAEKLERRRVGEREWVVLAPATRGIPADSIRVRLSRDGLPERIEVNEGLPEPAVYAFTSWKFTRPLGRSAFVVEAPESYEVVPMP
jgi:hypothetical protein